MEIKLNKGKISDLIDQFLRDKKKLEKIYHKNFLYIGFINSKNLDEDISFLIGDLNLFIYMIKKFFVSRYMRKFYDWDTIYNVKFLSNEVTKIKTEVADIKNEVADIKKKIEIIDEKISLLLGNKKIKINKRKRV